MADLFKTFIQHVGRKVPLHPDEFVCLLFQHAGKLSHYTVCHFVLAKQTFVEQTCLLVCLLACLRAPISWRKAQLGHSVNWCGWQYNLDLETVTLLPDKLAKLQQQLLEVARTTKTARKTLEKLLGLLMWATTTCPQLRPYMAPLYKDLRSKRGALRSVRPNMWQHFLHALTPGAVVARSPAGLWLPLGGQVLQVAGANVASKSDIPRVPRGAPGDMGPRTRPNQARNSPLQRQPGVPSMAALVL